jgi:hypothetical protein
MLVILVKPRFMVRSTLTGVQFSASMWTEDDVVQIQQTAWSVKSNVKLHAIPFGLQVEKGPDAIVEHLLETIPRLLG